MEKEKVLSSIAKRGNGEIYIGVVGAVRTGKSTFIKRCIENLVIPNIKDDYEKKRCLDEIPQSAAGKTIMTTEPKFVPSSGATISVGGLTTSIKMVDCVGYVIPGANGFTDEDGNERLVKCPWFEEPIPLSSAAEIGTEKVIKDHATIAIVVTTDGSITEFGRDSYVDAEARTIEELKNTHKPFIVVLNSSRPQSIEVQNLARDLTNTYDVPVIPLSVEDLNELEMVEILKTALYEFPVLDIKVSIPEWISVLSNDHPIKIHYIEKIKESIISVEKVKDVENILEHFKDSEYICSSYISELDPSDGSVTITLNSSEQLFDETLDSFITDNSKAGLIKMFSEFKDGEEERKSLNDALKMVKQTGYGIVYPSIKEMKLETPELVKQGSRYGVKLKAVASSIHLLKCDVESTFEPIIGSEIQSKELIDRLMKNYEEDKESIWKSEMFGRSLESIVREGIQAKLSMMPDSTRYKLKDTVTKIVNKGSNTLIAIVI